jgi:HlyD family secretion protein
MDVMPATSGVKDQNEPEPPSVPPTSTIPALAAHLPKWHALTLKKWIILALLVLVPALVLIIIFGYRWAYPTRSKFRTVQVSRADITERVTATGTLQPVITSPVGAQVSGIVWKLHADYNSVVKAGDLLVELDPALFQNAVASSTAQLAQAEANLSGAQATALGARIIRDRTQIVERKSLVSKADLDATVAIFGQTTGAARSSVALIALARAQLDRAKLDLEHSIIRSTVDGTVIARNIDVGQAVAATLTAPTLFTIAQDLHHMQVHASVDEADIGEVHAGQNGTFTVDAFRDDTFEALVHEVRNAAQTLSNVVTYDVVLDVENPELKLRPGMTANVLILIVQRTQVAAVPNEALRFRPVVASAKASSVKVTPSTHSSAAVYVLQKDVPTRVPIKVGITDGNLTEVEGLELGREVIIDVVRDKSKTSSSGGSGHGG